MKKLLFILSLILCTSALIKAQDYKGYEVVGWDLLEAKDAFVVSNGDTLRASTQLTLNDTTIVTLEYLKDSGQYVIQPFDYLQLNTGYIPSIPPQVGTTYWNPDDLTRSTVLTDNVTYEEGQELFADAINGTGVTIPNGTVVMYGGSVGASSKIKVIPAIADLSIIGYPEYVIGVATEDILSGVQGKVTTYGKVRGLTTDGSNYGEVWADEDEIYASPFTYGAITNIRPEAPYPAISLGSVIRAHATNGTLSIRPTFPDRLADMSDVNGTPLTEDGQFPVWIQDSGYFDFHLNINDYVPDSLWNNINSAARLYGGEITNNGDGTVHINAGTGLKKLIDAGPEDIPQSINGGQASELVPVSWDDIPSLALTDNAYNYIYLDGTDNTIKTTTDFYSISFTQDFTIGRAYREGTNVVARLCGTNAWNFNRRVQLFGEEVFPVVRGTGLLLSPIGTLQFNVSAGILWAELVNRFSVNSFNGTTTNFTYWYRDGLGGWTSASASQIDNERYDDGSGTLANLIAQRYGVHWIFIDHTGVVHVVYGRDSYTENQVIGTTVPFDLPGIVDAYATLIGRIIVKDGETTFYSIQSAFEQVFGFEQVPLTNHNDLPGLDRGEPGYYGHLTLDDIAQIDSVQINATNISTNSQAIIDSSASLQGQIDLKQDILTGSEIVFDGWDKNVSDDLQIGETSTTAYRGDRGKIAYDYSQVGHLPLTGGELSGSLSSDDINNRIRGMSVIQSGYVEPLPVNFRFDQDVLRYINRTTGTVNSSSGFSDSELDILFSEYADYVNLNGKTDGSYVEVTGFSFSNTANTHWYPYVLMHASNSNVVVKMEIKTSGSALWQELYNGTIGGYHIAEITSIGGNLIGARWTFSNIGASNIYVRSLGVIGRNSDGYQWTVMKGGDTMYGDLNFDNNSTVTIDSNPVWHSGNLDLTDGTIDADFASVSINGVPISSANPTLQEVTDNDSTTDNQIVSTVATGNAPISVSSTTLVDNFNTDLLDSNHGQYYDQRVYSDINNYLGGHYSDAGTQKPNSSLFGGGKLKLAMLQGSNLGFGGFWNDVLWLSAYNGSDVKNSHALVFDKYSTDVYVAEQKFDATDWGTAFKLWHTGNLNLTNASIDAYFNSMDADQILLSGVDLFGGLTSGYLPYWNGTDFDNSPAHTLSGKTSFGTSGDKISVLDSYLNNTGFNYGIAARNGSGQTGDKIAILLQNSISTSARRGAVLAAERTDATESGENDFYTSVSAGAAEPSEKVRIKGNSGNVLIGTDIDNGTDKLQVNGTASGNDAYQNGQFVTYGQDADFTNVSINGTPVDPSSTNELQTITSTDGSVDVTPSGNNYDLSVDVSGGGAVPLYDTITQVSHGLIAGKWIAYNTTGTVIYALADTAITADVLGIIKNVPDANTIIYQYDGIYTDGTWTEGANYFLSTTSSGDATSSQVYNTGEVYLFLGTGVENGLNIEIDVGQELVAVEYASNTDIKDSLDARLVDYFNKVTDDTDDITEGTLNKFYSSSLFNTDFGSKTTDNLTEGTTNKYYSSTLFDTDFGTKTTDNLTEGSTNKYNANHTGEVGGATALTIADNVIEAANLELTNTPTDGDVFTYDAASGGFTAEEQSGGGSSYSGCIAVSDDVSTFINFDTELLDTDGYHSNTYEERFYAPQTGLYKIVLTYNATVVSGNSEYEIILDDGSQAVSRWRFVQDEAWPNGGSDSRTLTYYHNMTSGDYIRFYAANNINENTFNGFIQCEITLIN